MSVAVWDLIKNTVCIYIHIYVIVTKLRFDGLFSVVRGDGVSVCREKTEDIK